MAKHIKFDISKDIDAQIGNVKSQIRNTENDLKKFSGNELILNKLKLLKEKLVELENEKL